MKIRPAKEKDLAKIEKLFHIPEISTATGEFLLADDLKKYLDEKYFLVAESEDGLIGAMFGEPLKADGVMLWLFAVAQSQRGKGVGDQMIKQFEKNAMEDNRSWMMLYAPADSDNTVNFYQNRSFTKGKLHFEFLKELGKKMKK